MAPQKSERPKTRNLVRWNDDMDKKLLLTIQWACNKKGVKIPWEMVGQEMGDTITESAVVQHMAKLRQRMVNENLPVPPPLTRGGRNERSTVHRPTASRITKRAPKKNVAKIAKHDNEDSSSDGDGAYKSDDEGAGNAGKKGKKKTIAKRLIKKEHSSHEHNFSSSAAESESDQAKCEPGYAVGDNMWSLNANVDARPKAKRKLSDTSTHLFRRAIKRRAHPSAKKEPSESSATKIVRLKIGEKGLAKLSRLAGVETSHIEENDDDGSGPSYNSSGSVDDGDAGSDVSAIYDEPNGTHDNGDFRRVIDDNAHNPEFGYGHAGGQETAFQQLPAAGYSTVLPTSAQHKIAEGVTNPRHHSSYYSNHANMHSFELRALLPVATEMSGYGNAHLSTTSQFGNAPGFFGDEYHDAGMLDFAEPQNNSNDYYDDSRLEHAEDLQLGSPFEDHKPKLESHENSWESADSFQAAFGDFPGAGNITQGAFYDTPLATSLHKSTPFQNSYFMPQEDGAEQGWQFK
ncbi:MAG: hypothetical protein L6R35_004720 [Caloplaca aegaea]|nr:MAG: hypothetical protein L6R35_004720 [Caloplaca aegaea]